MPFLPNLLVGIALQVIGFFLAPKPKQPKPPEAQDQEKPEAETGQPVPWVFGTMAVTGLNILHWSDKVKVEHNKDTGSKKK